MLSLKLSKGLRRLILEILSGEAKGEQLLKFSGNRQKYTDWFREELRQRAMEPRIPPLCRGESNYCAA
jgi:hypothetical protein